MLKPQILSKMGDGLKGTVFEDFENNYKESWELEGDAFQQKQIPSDVCDFLGKGAVCSFSESKTTGRITSKPFTIEKKALNFLIAGGDNTDSLCIRLVINGKVQKTATGDNTKVLKWNGWDVSSFIGQKAYLEIIDHKSDNSANASIAVDHIIFSDILMNTNLEHGLMARLRE